jgi:DNA polymerase-1
VIEFLQQMAEKGIYLDQSKLAANEQELKQTMSSLKSEIQGYGDVNPDKPDSVRDFLFNQLDLPMTDKGKSGKPSISATNLQTMANLHPVVPLVIKYSSAKYQMSQIKQVRNRVDSDGYIKWDVSAESASGRIYQSNPNIISLGAVVRDAMVPGEASKGREGKIFLAADFKSEEWALLIAKLQAADLIEMYKNNPDIHTANAAKMFGVKPEDVTPDQRAKAKRATHGKSYGQSPYGLSKQLGVSEEEARKIQNSFDNAFPGFKAKFDAWKQQIMSTGVAKSWKGHEFRIDKSADNLEHEAHRVVSMVMQRTGAELLVDNIANFKEKVFNQFTDFELVTTAHDSFIFAAPDDPSEISKFKSHFENVMEREVWGVELQVDWKQGETFDAVVG